MVLQRPRVPQVLKHLVLQVELLAASVRDGCAPRRRTDTHTRVGRRELAREWRVETNWEMKEPMQPKPAPGQNGIASGNE
jgi:hypothetical protein